MEIQTKTYQTMMSGVNRIIKHQKEIAILKGETFNVFSILKMESAENKTHSAFLGELLKPNGSHHMGNVFLKCFLHQINAHEHINIESAKVILEHSIGKRNDKEKTGGRVDIFIQDKHNNTICIENKIYAADQNVQIARYCNYNKEKNKVYYLTLNGDSPSKDSRADKEEATDFFTISYKDDIIQWLENCKKEAVNQPILRETINQYAILLKKITNQLSDKKMEQEIKEIIVNNYKAAKVIASNIEKVEKEAAKKFIQEIADKLKENLPNEFSVTVSKKLEKAWSGIVIESKEWPDMVLTKLEGDSGILCKYTYGLKANKETISRERVKELLKQEDFYNDGFKEQATWPLNKSIFNLGSTSTIEKIIIEKEREIIVNEVANTIIEFTLTCDKYFKNYNALNDEKQIN